MVILITTLLSIEVEKVNVAISFAGLGKRLNSFAILFSSIELGLDIWVLNCADSSLSNWPPEAKECPFPSVTE